jgi:hypothetical protein
MAWEIKDRMFGVGLIVAPTELQAWIMYFGAQGKHIDAVNFFKFVKLHKLAGVNAKEVR